MNFNQILIRLGIDATAVKSDLGRIGATVKAWGVSLVQDLKGSVGRLFAAGAAVEGLYKIKEQILEIARVSRETGASTNFIQGLMQESAKVGQNFDEMTGGIAKFNKLLGSAKTGNANAIITLKDMGVITKQTDLRTLSFTSAIHNLSLGFDKLNDKQKQAYLLSQAFGKSYAAMQPLFEKGVGGVDSLSGGNVFTKIGSGAIADYQKAGADLKSVGYIIGASLANLIDVPLRAITKFQFAFRIWWKTGLDNGRQYTQMMKETEAQYEKITDENILQGEADQEKISVEELKAKILDEQVTLLQKQAELTSEIADRDKLSVRDMAEKARHLLGQKSPLEMFHTVTPRMRTALQIDTLEDRSKLAYLKGDDAASARFQSQADQLRASSKFLTRADRDPLEKVNVELATINKHLDLLDPVLKLVTKSHPY